MPQQDRRAVTAAELVRNFGFWQTRALTAPVVVTHHGRARLVLMSAETFEELGAMEPASGADAAGDPVKLRSLALFSGLNRYMSEALLAFDADLRVVEVNHAAERFLNRSHAELLGLDFGQAFPSLVQSLIHDRLQRALKSGQSYDFETQSAVHPAMRVAVRIFPYDGGVGVIWTDITEREELVDSHQSLESLVQAMAAHASLGSCRLDARGRFKLAGGKLADWLGLAWSEMTDLHLDDLVIRADRKRVRDAFEASWESKTPKEVSACFMQRGGEDLLLELVLSPIVRDFAVQDMMMLATRGPGVS
jgi:PAS domain S-box-containing protein